MISSFGFVIRMLKGSKDLPARRGALAGGQSDRYNNDWLINNLPD